MTLWYVPQLVAVFLGLLLRAFPQLDSFMGQVMQRGRPVVFDLLYLCALSFFVLIVFMTGARTKSERMYMTMPISTRRIWISRMLSMLFVSQLSVILLTVIAAYRSPGGEEAVFLDAFTLRLGFHTAAAMAALLLLLQLPFMELGRAVKTVPFAVYAVFVSVVVVSAAVLTAGLPWAPWIFVLVAATSALWILIHLPASFSTMPLEPDVGGEIESSARKEAKTTDEPVDVASSAAVSPAITPVRRQIMLARVLINKWNYWLDCLLLVFYALMTVSAYYDVSRDNPWWLFGYIWIFAALMQSISRLKKIDFLPVKRSALFAMVMIPIITAIIIGAGIGRIALVAQPQEHRLISFYDGRLQIPLEFYELSTNGPPPALTSIWGEHLQPESHPLFEGSQIHIYRPYDTGPDSSPRFIALQIDRAVEAVHGIEHNPLDKYDDLDEEFLSAAGERSFTVRKSIGRNSETRSRVFALAGILSAAFYATIISLQIRFGGRRRGWNFLVPASVILIMIVIGSIVLAGRAGLCNPSFVEAVPPILLRSAVEAIPLSTAALWTVFALVCVLGYLALQSAFSSFEASIAKTSKTGGL
jgi:hypothetical protein